MKSLNKLGQILSSACCIFTVIVFIVLGGASLASDQVSALLGKNAVLFFVFALIFAVANQVFSCKGLSIVWRVTMHLALTMADFILCLFVFTGYYKEKGTFTVGASIAYAVVYLTIACVVLVIRSRLREKKAAEVPYKSQFSAEKKK